MNEDNKYWKRNKRESNERKKERKRERKKTEIIVQVSMNCDKIHKHALSNINHLLEDVEHRSIYEYMSRWLS